jgi:ABC-2 type transport system permease protein
VTATVAAELRKLRTVRVTWALLGTAVVLGAGMAALVAALSDPADLHGDTGGRLVLSSGGIAAGIVALLLGIVAAGGEHRHGTILPTLFVTPNRSRVALAHVAASAVAGAAMGAAAVAATVAVGLPVLAARDIPVTLSGGDLLGIAAGGVAFAALSAALGSALGALLRNQVVALALALLVLFVVEPVLTGLIDGYQRYSLTGVRVAITGGAAESAGTAADGLPSLRLALVLWTAYTAAFVAAAATLGTRRDIR